MNSASTCYALYWDSVLVGFGACLPLPSGTLKYAIRDTRTVILPDYQNLGFGTKLNAFLGEYYLSIGRKFYVRSSHLRLKTHCEQSPYWVASRSNGKVSSQQGSSTRIMFGKRDRELGRVAYSYEYMGIDYVNKPHLYLYIDNTNNSNIDYQEVKRCLIALKEHYWLCVVTGEINTNNEIEGVCLSIGVRTQLLYSTVNRAASINSKYSNEHLITKWDSKLSDWFINNIGNITYDEIPYEYCVPIPKLNIPIKNDLW